MGKGWIRVNPSALRSEAALTEWLRTATRYLGRLHAASTYAATPGVPGRHAYNRIPNVHRRLGIGSPFGLGDRAGDPCNG